MKIFAASDLHLDQTENLKEFLKIAPEPGDCLILAGDICETSEQLKSILDFLRNIYQHIVWTPGNHELWVRPSIENSYTSLDRYNDHIKVCRTFGVHTPEDPFLRLISSTGDIVTLATLFNLYDYSFRPDSVSREGALEWAESAGILCMDEALFRLGQFNYVDEWCSERISYSEKRLNEIDESDEILLVNHFPLLEKSFHLKKIPEFSIWCGSKLTEEWHQTYRAKAVINGHLHLPGKKEFDGVPFFDVSVGYPGQWNKEKPMDKAFTELFTGEEFQLLAH